ncbi:uncharacterized protein [Mobula birostris]|uniref:uncharacterized protein n=1 Tax=Mobula birostris TaxID=1983395 RepID=UPI003B27C09F
MFQIEKDFGDHFSKEPRVSVRSACADYMSDTASLVSELDETDNEVRKLTALAFRSLACPHNNYIDLSSSRASTDWSLSLSEDSSTTNKWSTYAELSEPSLAETNEHPANPIRAPSAKSEESREERAGHSLGGGHFECVDVAVETQEGRTVPKREIQFKKRERSELTVFRSNGANDGQCTAQYGGAVQKREESSVCREDAAAEAKEGASDRPLQRMESVEECSKKAKLASCHISNVISKKMQFEQELKMERGAFHETYSSVPSTPSSVNLKEFEFPAQGSQQEGKRRNSSAKPESDISGEDHPAHFRKKSCDLNTDSTDDKRNVLRQDSCGSLKGENITLDGLSNRDILDRWKESNTDTQKGMKSGRPTGLSGVKSQTALSDLGHSQSEVPTVRSTSEDTYNVDCIPQVAKNRLQASCLAESKLTGYDDKASHKQSGNKLDSTNAPRNILMSQTSEKTSASGTKHDNQVDLFGTVEQLAPNIGSLSKIITLDPKYQTLPASFKFETDGCRIKDLQFNRRESIQQRTKGPIHQVRDVRKLVKNTYGALRFNASEAKTFGSAQVLQPNGSSLAKASDQIDAAMNSTQTVPIYIECKSTGWKGNSGNYSNISVDKKYWTYAGSTDTSRSYSNDIDFLIPFNTNKSMLGLPQKGGTESQTDKKDKKECEVLTESTKLKNAKKKMIKDDKLQIVSASNKEETRAPLMKDNTVKDSKEKHGEMLAKQNLNKEVCNSSNESDKFKISYPAGIENQNSSLSVSNPNTKGKKVESTGANQSTAEKLRKDYVEPVPLKIDNKVPTNKVGSRREDSTKLHSENKHSGSKSSLNEDLNLMHGKADSKKEIQNRPAHNNKLQKIIISKNNVTKIVVEKNGAKSAESQNKHTLSLNTNDTKLSTGKDTSEKVNFRLDLQKTSSRISSLKRDGTQELTGKGHLNKESQARKLGNKNSIPEYSFFKTEKFKGNEEGGTGGQSKVEEKRKSSGSSMLNTPIGKEEDMKLALESKSILMSKSLSQTAELTKLSGRGEFKTETQVGRQKENKVSSNPTSKSEEISSTFGKYETVKDIQVRLENQSKVRGKLNEEKSGKIKAVSESQAGQDNQKRLPGYCTQTSESKNEPKKENQADCENQERNIEQAQTSEKSGSKMLKDPIKDSYVLSLILEEESSKNNFESTDDNIRNKQHSSVKNQALNTFSAQTPHSSSGVKDKQSAPTVKATNHHQTIQSTAKTSTHKLESHGSMKSTSGFAIDIPIPTSKVEYQDTTSQIHPSSAEFKMKTLPPINSVVRLFGQDQKQSSSAVMVQSTRTETIQEHGSKPLESVNYLAIPVKEQRTQPGLGQTTTSPHSATIKSMPYFQHQHSLEVTEPPRQEKELISHQVSQEPRFSGTSLQNPYCASSNQGRPQLSSCSPGTMPLSFAETICEVAQSSQETENPCVPCFQYPQTQRKMLVDPETGNYYFVDAPVQPSRRMLLDPVTGQYVEVVMSQQPFAGVYQVPFSPYLLHPGVMGPSYLPNMPYPGVFVGPSSPAQTAQRPLDMQSQPLSQQGSAHDKASIQHPEQPIQRTLSSDAAQMETLYYIPTGMTLYPNPSQPGLQQVAMQAKPCVDVNDSKTTGHWPIQQTYEVSSYLPHGRPSSFMVE